MKKFVLSFLVALLVLMLFSCGQTTHQHTYVDAVTPPSCLADGYTTHTCTVCGDSYTDSVTEKLPHTFVDEVTAPTCAAPGHTTHTCTVCGEFVREVIPTLVEPIWVKTLDQYIDYKTYQKECQNAYAKLLADTSFFEEAKKIADATAAETTYGLLSNDDIQALHTVKSWVSTITYQQAVEDVDLFFRTLKHAYSAYTYFGGDEAFFAAKEEVMASIAGQETVAASALKNALVHALSFVKDSHFNISGTSLAVGTTEKYQYYYCEGQYYAKDAEGYYKLVDGEKWYYDGCENPAVSMEVSVCPDGRLAYSPVRFCPVYDENGELLPDSDEITLRHGDVTQKQTIEWIRGKPYRESFTRPLDYKFLQSHGITYISVRSFHWENDYDMNKYYLPDAYAAKNSKAIIYDLRGNGGGFSSYPDGWVKNFTGTYPRITCISYNRENMIGNVPKAQLGITHGGTIANDIPIIVLVDDWVASAGEIALCELRSLGNVIVVGSNSWGCVLCGNVGTYYLKNSGISMRFGTTLFMHFSAECVDGRGYLPDIWCDPADALDVAIKLIEANKITDEDAVAGFVEEYGSLLHISRADQAGQ